MSSYRDGPKLSVAKGREISIEEVFLHRMLEDHIVKNNLNDKTALIYSGEFVELSVTNDSMLKTTRQMRTSPSLK